MSFLFLLIAVPALAKGSTGAQGQQSGQDNGSQNAVVTNSTITPAKAISSTPKATVSPTGNQVKNQNQVQTKNQGEDQQLMVKIQESEQLNQDIDDNFQKVSDQVHNLIDTVGAKGGIGQQVKKIAQNQTKLQDDIKTNVSSLASRSAITKFFVGSNKKTIQNMEQQMEQNRLMLKQLEQLKLQTKNSGDLDQIQQTINLMTYQNTSLQSKVDKENKSNGMFGWLLKFFNK